MAADVNLIQIAWEGCEQADYELQSIILIAAGIKPPARKDDDGEDPFEGESQAERMKRWAREHNAKLAASKRNKELIEKRRAEAKAKAKAALAAKDLKKE